MIKRRTEPAPAKKQPYRAPKLVVHGDLKTMTRAKGGTGNDGGTKPRTRASGSTA